MADGGCFRRKDFPRGVQKGHPENIAMNRWDGVKLTSNRSGRIWLEALAFPRRLRGYAHSHDDQQGSPGAPRVKAETITTQGDASP